MDTNTGLAKSLFYFTRLWCWLHKLLYGKSWQVPIYREGLSADLPLSLSLLLLLFLTSSVALSRLSSFVATIFCNFDESRSIKKRNRGKRKARQGMWVAWRLSPSLLTLSFASRYVSSRWCHHRGPAQMSFSPRLNAEADRFVLWCSCDNLSWFATI